MSRLSRQAWRYLLVGAAGTLAHLGVLAAAVEWGGLGVAAGSVAGFCAALALSYVLNRHWTFQVDRPGGGSFWRYLLVCLSGLALNTAMVVLLVDWLHWGYLLAQLSVLFVVPVSNFVLSRHWAFEAAR